MPNLESLLLENLSTHSVLVIGLAFMAGVVSSLLPCTIAMLPVLVGYMGAYSGHSKARVFSQVSLFIVGLALMMTILGVAASLLGVAFGALIGSGVYYIIGIIAILMALQLLNIIHIPIPPLFSQLPESRYGKVLSPIILGMTFGAASSPCGTPFLAAILAFISRENNLLLGGTSLFCYALGQGVLLLVVGVFTGLLKHMATLRHVGSIMTRLSAGLFLIVGAMLIAMGSGQLVPILRFLRLF